MDKKVVFAVAGAGKTSTIIDGLSLQRRFLLVTYTNNNFEHLRRRIILKFGHVPPNISIYTYFASVYAFCYRPLLQLKLGTRGITFDPPPEYTRRLKRDKREYYQDGHGRLYHNRLAARLERCAVVDDVRLRIQKYFDVFCVDEVQDIGGYDFDLLMALCKSEVDVLLVGDFFQHTYETSQDGPKNKNLHTDLASYHKRFAAVGMAVDTVSLSKSYRCSPSVCDFIRERLGVEIHSHSNAESDVLFVDDAADAERLFADDRVVKLFYKEHKKYPCFSDNWGSSKGADHYKDVCVALNGTTEHLVNGGTLKATTSLQTRNKLYVACSRPRRHLYFVSEKLFKKFKK